MRINYLKSGVTKMKDLQKFHYAKTSYNIFPLTIIILEK